VITKAADAFPSLLLARIFNLHEMGRLFLSSLLSTVAFCAAQQNTLVDLGYARYQGSINNETGNIKFLGIRYAAPLLRSFPNPVVELRKECINQNEVRVLVISMIIIIH